jgi:hypothetical protein
MGKSVTVVGVFPRKIEALGRVDIVDPDRAQFADATRDNHNYGIVARLKPGVTAGQAQAEMDGIAKRLEREYPATNTAMGVWVVPINELLIGRLRSGLLVPLASTTPDGKRSTGNCRRCARSAARGLESQSATRPILRHDSSIEGNECRWPCAAVQPRRVILTVVVFGLAPAF